MINQKIDTCRATINKARTELDTLSRQETNSDLKNEYQAMILDYQGASIDMDISKNNVDIITKNLSQSDIKIKVDINKNLITQYLDVLNKLETQYKDTTFFKTNYGTTEGQNQLLQAKQSYQNLLQQYNNITE